MKNLLLTIFFIPFFLIAQNISPELNENITGIITISEGAYLVLEQGFIRINEINPYIEYYRQIYNDSTIVNPNTELRENFNLNIIPFLSPAINQQRIDFSEPLKLGLLVQMNQSGGLDLTKFTKEYLDSLNKSNAH